MKRRALLSGIVPAVAGAAGACRSSVADVLIGGVQPSASLQMTAKFNAAWAVVNQWLSTMVNNNKVCNCPVFFENVDKDDDRMRNAVSKRRLVRFKFSPQLNMGIVSSSIDSSADVLLIESVRAHVAEHVRSSFAAMNLVRHRELKLSEISVAGEQVRHGIHTQYHEDVDDTPGVDFRHYYVKRTHKIPMSMNLSIYRMEYMIDGTIPVEVAIDTKVAVDQHEGKITCVEGSYKGLKWSPDIVPIAFPQ